MTKKKSSNRQRNALPKIKRSTRPNWMRIPGILAVAIFTVVVLLLVVMSAYRYYHIISHH